MKIQCMILRKNKRIKYKKVSPNNEYFVWNNGVYILDSTAVMLEAPDGRLNPTPMLCYFEGIPTPIRLESPDEEESAKLLDDFVQEMNLKSTGIPSYPKWDILTKYIENPEKLFGIISILLVVYVLIQTFLLGGISL